MSNFVLYPLNDNEKKGLPTDIDLLELSVKSFLKNQTENRRIHLHNLLIRVLEQVKFLLRESEINFSVDSQVYNLNTLLRFIDLLKSNPKDINLIYSIHNNIIFIRNNN